MFSKKTKKIDEILETECWKIRLVFMKKTCLKKQKSELLKLIISIFNVKKLKTQTSKTIKIEEKMSKKPCFLRLFWIFFKLGAILDVWNHKMGKRQAWITNKMNEISSDRKPNQRGKIWNLH